MMALPNIDLMADWTCGGCSQQNRPDAQLCVRCQADVTEVGVFRAIVAIEWFGSEYWDEAGAMYACAGICWEDVTAYLGHPHSGSPEDDDALRAALLAAGAPEWVREAEGFAGEDAWALIGPRLD